MTIRSLEIINEHFLYYTHAGELCLVDTGAMPGKVAGSIEQGYEDAVNRTVGTTVDKMTSFQPNGRLLLRKNTVEVIPQCSDPLPAHKWLFPWKRNALNLPIVELTFNGISTPMLLDTGARVHFSISEPKYVQGCPSAGTFQDYLALLGHSFNGLQYKVPVTSPGGFAHTGMATVLPPSGYDQFKPLFPAILSGWQLWQEYDLCIDGKAGLALIER